MYRIKHILERKKIVKFVEELEVAWLLILENKNNIQVKDIQGI